MSELVMDSPGDDNPGESSLAWYVIQTKPRQEHVALENLLRQGYESYLPMMRREKMRSGRLLESIEPMFSRYMFIRLGMSLADRSWGPIRSTIGVSQLVRFGGQPAAVRDDVIDCIRQAEQSLPVDKAFQKGDALVVADGPFKGLTAVFELKDANERAMVFLDLLGKRVIARFDFNQIRKAD